MNKIAIVIFLIFFLGTCKNQKQSAREPIDHQKTKIDTQSISNNIHLNQIEEKYIKKMIEQDSLNQYYNQGQGFWFHYIQKNDTATYKPVESDRVVLTYEIRDLSDNIIYSFDEIGEKTYIVDKENIFRGFREAVKLLKEGEEALFLLPSNAAYGYHGDEKRIGHNIPLKLHLKIKKIIKYKN